MSKYKNISNHRIVVTDFSKVITVKPNEIVDLSVNPYPNFLIEVFDKEEKDIEKNEEVDFTSDLPEDLIVLLSDSIVEDLKKEQAPKPQKRKRRNNN